VVAYPEPCRYPYRYRVDLLVPDDIDLDDFRKMTAALRECFGGRHFRIGAALATVTLYPSGAYRNPLLFVGSPSPFLREHLQRHARTIFGSGRVSFRGSLARADLVEWCRGFLPYHLTKYRRALHADAWPDGPARLAQLRLFLECDEIVTDYPTLIERYVDHVPGCPRGLREMERLFGSLPGTEDPEHLEAALGFLASESGRVEALLEEEAAGAPHASVKLERE
jgi:hypothetical protein